MDASLTLKSFPKTRREITQSQVAQFRALARGDKNALRSYKAKGTASMRHCLVEAGILSDTRATWEAELVSPEKRGFYGEDAPQEDFDFAVNEVLALRRAAAYEQRVTAVALGYLTFPKSRRAVTEEQVARLMLAAQGRVQVAYAGTNSQWLHGALINAGARGTLTRASYEAERV